MGRIGVIVVPAVLACLCIGCASGNFQTEHIDESESSLPVKLFGAGAGPPGEFTSLGRITATSCKRMMWNPPASRTDALMQMRRQVASVGGDGITELACRESGASFIPDCWSSVQCTGVAIKMKPKPPAIRRAAAPSSVTGTAFYVTATKLVTADHVVQRCVSIEGEISGERFPLKLVVSDRVNDIALLSSIRVSQSRATFRQGTAIRSGEDVIAVGFPLQGLLAKEANVDKGSVSATSGLANDSRKLQITTPVQPGNSGGPLFDLSGNVVGVVEAKLNAIAVAANTGDVPQNVNFAIKSEVAKTFLEGAGVQFAQMASRSHIAPADIGDAAKKYTVFVTCKR